MTMKLILNSQLKSVKSRAESFQVSKISNRAYQCTHTQICKQSHSRHIVMYHQIFCVKCFYEDCSAKHTLKVLKQGHCDRVKVHHEQVKDRQTIMGTDSRLCGMIWATESKWAQSSYQGQPHCSDQQPSDMILYGGSYLRWWNGGEERVQSTTDPKNGRFRHMSRARQTSAYTHTHIHTNTGTKTT